SPVRGFRPSTHRRPWLRYTRLQYNPPRRESLMSHVRRCILEALENRSLLAVSLSIGSNVNISHSFDSEAEGAITIDPTNPNRMFVLSNDAQAGLFSAYSTNAGKSWTRKVIATGHDSLPS